jgi:hypothetical protein
MKLAVSPSFTAILAIVSAVLLVESAVIHLPKQGREVLQEGEHAPTPGGARRLVCSGVPKISAHNETGRE